MGIWAAPTSGEEKSMQEVFGYIERITFYSPESGFTVARLKEPRKNDLTCLVGVLPALQPGESVRCSGTWKHHAQHGAQFEVAECHMEAPSDIIGIQKYLESGLIKGIGPAYAKRIVAAFGIDTLKVIDETPEKLRDVQGLGEKRVERIKTCWQDQKAIRDVMIFLQQYNVSPTYAQKIFKAYGAESIQKVTDNPYTLATDIHGIGFKTADTIAKKLGMPNDSPKRIEAGVQYVLSELSDDGHTCHPVEEFLPIAQEMLEVPVELVEGRLGFLEKEGRIVRAPLPGAEDERFFIWSKMLHICETGVARELIRLIEARSTLRSVDTSKAIAWVQEKLHIALATHQEDAVSQALTSKVQIITGGPGTGKSTITKAILAITEKLTDKITLAAPTGRAAKRMCEITGKKASTIHSLLEYNFKAGGFKRNRENPIECDLIIIDEASMIDTVLMYQLLRAIPAPARVIFVGDINQLPSVGPGNVLKDLISSECLPVTMLTQIFRQAAGSKIITNAHLINEGVMPDIKNEPSNDFFFIYREQPEDILAEIVELVSTRLPKKYRLNPFSDIQVLAPMKRGIIGTENLNVVLQEKLNHKENTLLRGSKKFGIGDKVMQMRNNYDKEVYNGDVGRIAEIDMAEQEVIIDFDGRGVVYEFSDLDEIVLAYAVSVHKYQGSECPCIIIPLHTTHFKLLHRNLLYTGVTRGKKLVVIVGTTKALSIAVHNDEVKKRYTAIKEQLMAIGMKVLETKG